MAKRRKTGVRRQQSSRKRAVLIVLLLIAFILLVLTITLPSHGKAIVVAGAFGCEATSCEAFCTTLRMDPLGCSQEQVPDKKWMACACGD